jgi:hypothetical protein
MRCKSLGVRVRGSWLTLVRSTSGLRDDRGTSQWRDDCGAVRCGWLMMRR